MAGGVGGEPRLWSPGRTKGNGPGIESQVSVALQMSPSAQYLGQQQMSMWLGSSWADMLSGEHHSRWKG